MDGEMTPCVTPHNSVTQLPITSEKPFPNVPTGVKGELRRGFSIRREAAAVTMKLSKSGAKIRHHFTFGDLQ